MNESLVPVNSPDDIPPAWRDTPVADLLECHNFGKPHREHARAELLIGMCMDYRQTLRIPHKFAFILRVGGANLRPIEFNVSFAIAVGGVRSIALIGHDDCRMTHLTGRRGIFVHGLVEAGWSLPEAETHFDSNASSFEIANPAEFVRLEAHRLRERFPKVVIAPLLYSVEEGRLYQIRE